jgi:hypothetical protein
MTKVTFACSLALLLSGAVTASGEDFGYSNPQIHDLVVTCHQEKFSTMRFELPSGDIALATVSEGPPVCESTIFMPDEMTRGQPALIAWASIEENIIWAWTGRQQIPYDGPTKLIDYGPARQTAQTRRF